MSHFKSVAIAFALVALSFVYAVVFLKVFVWIDPAATPASCAIVFFASFGFALIVGISNELRGAVQAEREKETTCQSQR